MKSPDKILVFRQSSLGDVVLTLPVLQRLREALPNCRIDYITKTQYRPILEQHPAIANVYAFGTEDEFRVLVREVRSNRYDLFIDLQSNFRSHYIRLRIPRAGVIRYKKRRLARELIVRRPGAKLAVEHTIKAYLAPLRKLGIEAKVDPPVLYLSSEAKEFADEYIRINSLSDKTMIALCPGAGHKEKMWPPENFRELADMLLENPQMAMIIFRTSSDQFPRNLGIADSRLIEAKDLELLPAAAILSKCRLAVTNDSGLMHLANSVGTPVVAIFGPTNPRLGFAPALPGSRVICDDVSCSPCSLHGQKKCYQPRKFCFENITPKRVLGELEGILTAKRNTL
ncbi:MAG: hypothetical protein A2W25_14560 [candidate division Zixibacteria bacterium RBG_16_53_22]|nr:MAG: hypothetical protein A2W25_14560 [candidate division Zixibacteria bacterium RBG_16_53_22]